MTAQLVMRMLEEYVLWYDIPDETGEYRRERFKDICFYIIPMINPDGVTMCQFNPNMNQLKANSNGVDLNRNFSVGFGAGHKTSQVPGLCYYSGAAPLSEAETIAVSQLVTTHKFLACINYHSMGKLNYYGASTNTPEVAAACKNLAAIVRSINGYKNVYCGSACGSFADYFGAVQSAPSVTIEIGTANPVPISQFSDIYNRNIKLWDTLAILYKPAETAAPL